MEENVYNIDESISEIKKYFKKLFLIIEREASFSFGDTKVVDKRKIDDVLCCIESFFPKKYLEYTKVEPKKYRSFICYKTFLDNLKKTFFLFPNKYVVDVVQVTLLVKDFVGLLNSDLKKIFSNV